MIPAIVNVRREVKSRPVRIHRSAFHWGVRRKLQNMICAGINMNHSYCNTDDPLSKRGRDVLVETSNQLDSGFRVSVPGATTQVPKTKWAFKTMYLFGV